MKTNMQLSRKKRVNIGCGFKLTTKYQRSLIAVKDFVSLSLVGDFLFEGSFKVGGLAAQPKGPFRR